MTHPTQVPSPSEAVSTTCPEATIAGLQKIIEDLELTLAGFLNGDPVGDRIEEAMALCPTCAGLPVFSVNRCDLCRRLQRIILQP